MDFLFSAEDEAFRAELQQFLKAELPAWYHGHYNEDEAAFQVTLDIAGKMAQRGWLTMDWPHEFGGQDAPIWKQVIMREEMWVHHEPRGQQYMSTNWIGPSIMLFGTDEQKQEHLSRIAQGKALWAQGFSEPNAGSDLAALETRAVKDGDDYVINGEKIWTSHTPHAEWIFVLTRTDPNAPKHKGISVFLVDRQTPGITIEPIRSMFGYGEFAHVIFNDVRVPARCRLGPENDGWTVTIRALQFERVGAPRFITSIRGLDALMDFAQHAVVDGKPLYANPLVRQRIAQLRIEAEVAKLLYYRAASLVERGEDTTLVGALSRVHGTVSNQRVSGFAMELLGAQADVEEDSYPFAGTAAYDWARSMTATVAAGTLEVQKNTIATRGLGLPR